MNVNVGCLVVCPACDKETKVVPVRETIMPIRGEVPRLPVRFLSVCDWPSSIRCVCGVIMDLEIFRTLEKPDGEAIVVLASERVKS